jgi:hypothetical protein
MELKELYEKIRSQNFNMRKGISNSVNHTPFIEQTKNVLFNNTDAIEEALKYAVEAEQKIKVLEVELNDAEAEIDELTAKTKTTAKNKKKAADAGE